jgi:hypothetical protein
MLATRVPFCRQAERTSRAPGLVLDNGNEAAIPIIATSSLPHPIECLNEDVSLSFAMRTFAAGPDEAGFWPVVSRPSSTT